MKLADTPLCTVRRQNLILQRERRLNSVHASRNAYNCLNLNDYQNCTQNSHIEVGS